MTETGEERPARPRWHRIALAAAITAALTYGAYAVLNGSRGGSGAIGLTFLLVVPAAVCAIISFITDPHGERDLGHYLKLPLLTLAVIVALGFVFLGEGVICILVLAPLWLGGGIVGSLLVYSARKRVRDRGRLSAATALLIPLMSAQLETELPVPVEWRTVSRETLIDATPEQIWPLLVSIPAIRPDEGRWNVSQDLLGVPRPTAALLDVEGGRPVRRAAWGPDVRFEERILHAVHARSISWTFAFPDDSIRRHTDEHIAPDGAQLHIAEGGYRLTPTEDGRTRVRLDTRYRLRTPLNFYAAWWGERLLGDIQSNVLAIVRDRAEDATPPRS